jgi:L-malate glycosyltransferase
VRVAFCIDNMNVGGTELNAVRTAERLDRSRYRVSVVSLQRDGPLVQRYRAAGLEVHPFPLRNLYGASAIRQGRALARWLRAERVEILHAHDIYSNVFGVIWGRAAGVRTIASRRWWEGFPQAHWRAASGLGYRLADAVLANSPAVGELLRAERVAEGKITVVPNFVDEQSFDCPAEYRLQAIRKDLGLEGEHRVIGIVANLHPVKDHASLFRALALLTAERKELRLVLVGDGDQREALVGLARELGISDHVIFAGRRGNDPNLHHLFEMSVLCSLSEGLSNSILEAMAAGRPIVATAVGAASDAVQHERTGLLVPPGDPQRLAAALEELLSDPARARAMGEAGRQRARQLYSPEAAIDELESLYARLAPRAPRSGGGLAPVPVHSSAR